jgi:UDP-glucose 4-epimerase
LFLGGNGFLGRNVREWYSGHVATEEDRTQFVVAGRTLRQESAGNTTFIPLDFSDRNSLRAVFETYPIDEVFHFISASLPSNSNANMTRDIEVNLLGTVHLLELMAAHGVPKITFISSGGAIYGDDVKGVSQEEDFNNPNNSYGVVKLAIEKYIGLFQKLHGIQYLILRLSNPFGMHHQSTQNGIVNIAIRKAIRGETVKVWGDGSNTKDYIFASDFARIFWELHAKGIKNRILNVGSGELHTVIDLLENIQKILPDLHWNFEPAKSFDTRKVQFGLDSLHGIVQEANTPFLDALRQTLAWEMSQTGT